MTTRLLMTADAVGGVWQYATELARALVPHGFETTIAVLGPEATADQLSSFRRPRLDPGFRLLSEPPQEEAGPRVKPGVTGEGVRGVRVIPTNLPLDWLSSGPDPVLAAGAAIADLARDPRADLVHLNSPTLAAAAHFDRPVVAVAHGCVATWWRAANGCEPDAAYRWQADLMRRGLLAADVAVAPSASFAADLQSTYALPHAPRAVHNGRTPVPVAAHLPPADHVFTAGRLWDRVKNTPLLDRIAAKLSVPLRAAGPVEGPHGERAHTEHLHLLGQLDAAAVAREFAARPIFVSAASFEPFGLAVLEAAGAGCPLVLSGIDTFRELWTGAALFVDGDDEAAWVESIGRVRADPDLRARLSDAARVRSARYSVETMAGGMAGIYARLLQAKKAAA